GVSDQRSRRNTAGSRAGRARRMAPRSTDLAPDRATGHHGGGVKLRWTLVALLIASAGLFAAYGVFQRWLATPLALQQTEPFEIPPEQPLAATARETAAHRRVSR